MQFVSVGSKHAVLAVDGFCYSSSFSHNCYVDLHKSQLPLPELMKDLQIQC